MEHDDRNDEFVEMSELETIADEEDSFEAYLARVAKTAARRTGEQNGDSASCKTAASAEESSDSGQFSPTLEISKPESSSSAPVANGAKKELVQDCNFAIPKPDAAYIQSGLNQVPLSHPIAPAVPVPDGYEPPTGETIDDGLVHDDVFQAIFNETVLSIAALPFDNDDDQIKTLGIIEDRITQLDDFIKKAKIQQIGLRTAKEDRLKHASAKTKAKKAEADAAKAPRKKMVMPTDASRTKAQVEKKKTAGKTPGMKTADTMAGLGMKGAELKQFLEGRKLLDEATSKYVDDKYSS